MSFGKIGHGFFLIGGERIPAIVTEISHAFGAAPEFRGHFLEQGYAVGGLIASRNPSIKNVIFNAPATVVIWEDGTKTVVKCQPGDTYSKETGLALCIAKKYLGNKGNFNEVFKKWIPEETEPVEEKVLMSFQEDAETGEINLLTSNGISIGDEVRVVDEGQLYSTYRDWVERHVKDPADAAKWEYGRALPKCRIGVVKYLAAHEWSANGDIAYIEIDNKCYMINVRGLKRAGEISVDDMRSRLNAYCNDRECNTFGDNECPLVHGCRCMFTSRKMDEDEIRAAYKTVFGEEG